jgi:Zn-dependent oligopeptidase
MHLWDTMAQHPENAKQCIENIQKNARQKAEKENSFLKEMPTSLLEKMKSI